MERFWKKVRILSPDECWEWLASKNKYGYGKSCLNGKDCPAHRVAYQLTFGPMAKGMVIDHTCRNRGCVNPSHLRQVTPYQNLTENSVNFIAINKQKTHCPKGHAYDLIHPNSGARG